MSFSAKTLPLVAALAAVLLLSACDKKDTAVDETAVSSSEATESTEVITDSDTLVKNATEIESTDLAEAKSSVVNTASENNTATESQGVMLPSAAGTAKQSQPSLMSNPVEPNTPEATVKAAIDTLYYGDAKEAASYYQVDMANFAEELAKTQYSFQQTVTGVTLTDTTYNADKTQANIVGEIRLKGQTEPAPLAYTLQKIAGKWKILG